MRTEMPLLSVSVGIQTLLGRSRNLSNFLDPVPEPIIR